MLCHEIFLAAEEISLGPGTDQTGQGQGNSVCVSTPERWIVILYILCFGEYPERERGHQSLRETREGGVATKYLRMLSTELCLASS
jgi:hypothetical protein